MKYIVGLSVSLIGFYFASKHLNQSISEYWDQVAFYVVFFGTASVLFVTFPAVETKSIWLIFASKFFLSSSSLRSTAQTCMDFFNSRTPLIKAKTIEMNMLNDGLELMSLGFKREKIQDILTQRFEHHSRKLSLLSLWLRKNSKYPPAFGLAGTVLGLIHLMRGISAGVDTKETGMRMAIALVATFYGLLIANLILNPLGEWVGEQIKKDELKAEMAIETILASIDNINVVEFQETLNSYLEHNHRLDAVSGILNREAAAA